MAEYSLVAERVMERSWTKAAGMANGWMTARPVSMFPNRLIIFAYEYSMIRKTFT